MGRGPGVWLLQLSATTSRYPRSHLVFRLGWLLAVEQCHIQAYPTLCSPHHNNSPGAGVAKKSKAELKSVMAWQNLLSDIETPATMAYKRWQNDSELRGRDMGIRVWMAENGSGLDSFHSLPGQTPVPPLGPTTASHIVLVSFPYRSCDSFKCL